MKKSILISFSILTLISNSLTGQLGSEKTPDPPVIPSENKCILCHTEQAEQKVMHYPATEDCETCHMSNGNAHPPDSLNLMRFDLADEMPGLCFMCHEEHTKTNKHAPVEMGECLMCHSAHGSPNKSLLITAPQSALCADCHDMAMTERNVKHKPVAEGSCSACHDAHRSDNLSLLKTEKKSLCIQCHTQERSEAEMEYIHYPFDDDCGYCHDSHSSEEPGLLIQKSPALCYNCHDMESAIIDAAMVHGVLNDEKACSNCHSPHASKQGMLLLESGKALCLSCHDKPVKSLEKTLANIGEMLKEGNYIHGVIEMDGCTVCHSPHVSENQALLTGVFPQGAYAEAVPENFDLCFTCHDAELMETDSTDYATNFRNDEQNLHFLHINGTKGRNCNLCHNMHGSANEHLIADKVRFGNWDMPVGFKSSENGGSCLSGCHAEKAYSRNFGTQMINPSDTLSN